MLTKELPLATLLVILVATLHLTGLALLLRILKSHWKVYRSLRTLPLTLLLTVTLGIIGLHTIEVWFYAGLYLYLGLFQTVEESLYFSTVTYSSLGYGDVLLPNQWRVLGSIECPVGVIMLGLSTAFMISVVTRYRLLGHDWLSGENYAGPGADE